MVFNQLHNCLRWLVDLTWHTASFTINGEYYTWEKFCACRGHHKTFTPENGAIQFCKYYKHIDPKRMEGIQLPTENGLLSQVISLIVIKEANHSVSEVVKLQVGVRPLC